MPSVQIKNVPPDVHGVLRRRAAKAGQSLQEYLLSYLTDEARRPTLDELFQDREERSGGSLSFESAVKMVREDRESH
jgi:plasmid stability protein